MKSKSFLGSVVAVVAIMVGSLGFFALTAPETYAGCNSGFGRFDPTCPGRPLGRPNEDSGSDIPVQPPVRPTTSSINFCNRSSQGDLYATYLSYDAPNGWQSHGWYKVSLGTCRNVLIGRAYNGDIFVHAQSGNTTWGSGGTTFCVHSTQSFEIPNADQSCDGEGYKRVAGSKLTIRTGRNTWNLR